MKRRRVRLSYVKLTGLTVVDGKGGQLRTTLNRDRSSILCPGICTLVLAFGVISTASADGVSSGYHVSNKFTVAGNGAWDYLSIDPGTRRLYVTHATQVNIIDADTGKDLGRIENTPGVHGVALALDLGKGFTSNGKANTVSVVDLKTLDHTAEIKVGKKPDAIIYDPSTHRVFVSDGDSDEMTVIDAVTERVAGTIALGGNPEFSASDDNGTVWVNVEHKNSIGVIDAKALKLTKTIPVKGCDAPGSMAIDRANRRLFIGCSENNAFVVVNPDTGETMAKFPVGEHVDSTVFDPESGLIFSATGDGHITVVHEDTPDKYTLMETITTMRGAKTLALDPKTKKLFLATVENVPANATGPPQASGPKAYKPGPFVVLVVEK
jgi:YVTN family beta-propeller protein